MRNFKRIRRLLKGVTLLEILVAMVVLTGGLFMLYNIFPKGFAASYRSKNQTIATQLAQGKLEELLKKKAAPDCQEYHSATCLYRPPRIAEDNITPYAWYNWDYGAGGIHCAKVYGLMGDYGVSGSVRGATYCADHMGVVDDPTSWVQFPDNPWFWYHIQVAPVLDPSSNAAAQTRKTLFRDYGSCSRLTVRVRGPVDNMNSWNTIQSQGGTRLPAEVVLSTFVANKIIAVSDVNVSYTNTNFALAAAPHVWNDPSKALRLRLYNIRNFIWFNHLTNTERNPSHVYHHAEFYSFPDSRQVLHRPYGAYTNTGYNGSGNYPEPAPNTGYVGTYGPYYVGNRLGLDNIAIVRRDSCNNVYHDGDDRLLIQTNKIISVCVSGTGPASGRPAYEMQGDILLAQPLYFYKDPSSSMIKCTVSDAPEEGLHQANDPSAPIINQDPTIRRFALFTSSHCTPTGWANGYFMYGPPSYPAPFALPALQNRAVKYEVLQYVTVPRQSGTSLDVF